MQSWLASSLRFFVPFVRLEIPWKDYRYRNTNKARLLSELIDPSARSFVRLLEEWRSKSIGDNKTDSRHTAETKKRTIPFFLLYSNLWRGEAWRSVAPIACLLGTWKRSSVFTARPVCCVVCGLTCLCPPKAQATQMITKPNTHTQSHTKFRQLPTIKFCYWLRSQKATNLIRWARKIR